MTDEAQQSERREWTEPRVERLDVGLTRSGSPDLDEELIPQTNPPS